MKKDDAVSLSVIKRLPKYFRYLTSIADKGIVRVSSKELSSITGLTASQIRQDLNHYGCFGQQGYGYNVKELINELSKILGIDRKYKLILIGYGNIGHALFNYEGFSQSGYTFEAIFDSNPEKIGKEIDGIKIFDVNDLENYLSDNEIDIAVLSIPKEDAQKVANVLCKSNIDGIWNFAPEDLKTTNGVVLENVHLDESLYTLTYFINNPQDYVFGNE
ncbi:MAG: redox-sensing transcriptional repressor Rex [Peptoniphilaceae bacterium]|nr:redox-sensing transcriptional repressor Rex [Peptoniphilaceae bacterium]MDD7383252.1 redox-sensing transcriptional repressor Rex [Peptoniphilaceae bacterium]MDY3737991.1 redox-sensing transcriptional repressor Rex [Peptoniphilaceae bacterium]